MASSEVPEDVIEAALLELGIFQVDADDVPPWWRISPEWGTSA